MKITSGFQTGVDLGAIYAAYSKAIETGGWMPKGFKSEDGFHPEFAGLYKVREHTSSDYPPRTRLNVQESDITIWLGEADSAGFACTMKAVKDYKKLSLVIGIDDGWTNKLLASRLLLFGDPYKNSVVINFAGSRESKSPGIQEKTQKFLGAVFKEMIGY